MKINLALILSVIAAVGLVALGFTAFQISSERQRLKVELEIKTVRVAENFYDKYLRKFENRDTLNFSKITDSVMRQYNFSGISYYFNADSIIKLNAPAKPIAEHSVDFISRAIAADSSMGNLITVNSESTYEYVKVIKRESTTDRAVIFYTSAEYIKNIINDIWLRNFLRWFLQALIISVLTLLIVRWGILTPLNKVVDWVRAARSGNIEKLKERPT